MEMEQRVILVNEQDQETGTMEKMKAHEQGLLHRAFSVFVFNTDGELLLQKRAAGKYHSGGLWTNTCCGHPQPGETVTEAGQRRLKEEMGMALDLSPLFHFRYKAGLDKGLTEHEIDHVLFAISNKPPVLNPDEAEGYGYHPPEDIQQAIAAYPDHYTAWFRICFEETVNRVFPGKLQPLS